MLNEVLIELNIIHGAIWGVLARLGLEILTEYQGVYVGGVIWPNFIACLVIALFGKFDKQPIIVGITTGFCGTLSSFSSYILEAFEEGINLNNHSYPTKEYGILQVILVILTQLGVSVFGFHIGKDLQFTIKYPSYLHYVSAFLGVVLYIAAIVLLGTYQPWRPWMFSILFAAPGALMRYYLSKFNKGDFPMGTFLANIIGSTLIAVFSLVSMAHNSQILVIKTVIHCEALLGAIDGFCGGLTTVSTFVNELFKLNVKLKYRYVIISIVSCFCVVLVILGSYHWTKGLVLPVCSI